MGKKVAVLLTCHNRIRKTVQCLEALYSCDVPDRITIKIILVDDGSTDGTGETVRELFPDIEVIEGNGDLYWNRGMHLAFSHAIGQGFDAYIWLNDDTVLHSSSIVNLCETANALQANYRNGVIVVGSAKSKETGKRTYGGIIRNDRLLQKSHLIEPGKEPLECNAMNGNIVYIPMDVVTKIGNLDASFRHAMGDIDYALRAVKAGVRIFVAPGYLGICEANSPKGTYFDKSLPRKQRWKKMLSPTGLPPRSWLIFTRRHYGIKWPLYFVWPYLKVWI